jgi:glycosyltransferase involved in cell wall biosynthesis
MTVSTPGTDVTVIILTFNEATNIAHALGSVQHWAKQVFVVDSFSTDATLQVAARFPCTVVQHRFENYAKQRNFALSELPIRTEWIFFLDADEWIPDELKNEISAVIARHPPENGFLAKSRFIWMGKWIRRGYYPSWVMRFARFGKVVCEDRPIGEHLIVEGPTGKLANDYVHEDRKDISAWIAKHNQYSDHEALELLRNSARTEGALPESLFGTQAQRKRWVRNRVWGKLPPLIRPLAYFVYRYFIKGGFLDGREALSYHFLQAFWFQMLVDTKYLELRRRQQGGREQPRGSDPSKT